MMVLLFCTHRLPFDNMGFLCDNVGPTLEQPQGCNVLTVLTLNGGTLLIHFICEVARIRGFTSELRFL